MVLRSQSDLVKDQHKVILGWLPLLIQVQTSWKLSNIEKGHKGYISRGIFFS